jgi:glycogen operon protein
LRAPRFPEPAPARSDEPVADTGIAWFNPDGSPVSAADWDNPDGHSFTALIDGRSFDSSQSILLMMNAYWQDVAFTLPAASSGQWSVILDTSSEDGTPNFTAQPTIQVGARSVVVART